MNRGELSPGAIRLWVANRFYYQKNIPIKDAALLSNCPDREVRRVWLHRITDHDGRAGDEGGIEAWLKPAGWSGRRSGRTRACSPAPGSPSTPTSISPAPGPGPWRSLPP